MRHAKEVNLVLLPPASVVTEAIKISKMLRAHGARFVLGKKRAIPHVTIYASVFPQKNIAAVKKTLAKITRTINPIRLDKEGYKDGERGYVLYTYKKTRSLQQLQKNIIAAIDVLRENNIRPKDKKNFKNLPSAQRANLLRYGSRYVGTTYHPHLTISKLKGHAKPVLRLLPKADLSFAASRLALYTSGENGTCGTLLASWKLRNK